MQEEQILLPTELYSHWMDMLSMGGGHPCRCEPSAFCSDLIFGISSLPDRKPTKVPMWQNPCHTVVLVALVTLDFLELEHTTHFWGQTTSPFCPCVAFMDAGFQGP